MNTEKLWMKFVGEWEKLNPFHRIVCDLIVKEAEQGREPLVNTLLWLKHDEDGQLVQYFRIGDDRHDNYDLDAVIFALLHKTRRSSRPVTPSEKAYITQQVIESGTRRKSWARGKLTRKLAKELNTSINTVLRVCKGI